MDRRDIELAELRKELATLRQEHKALLRQVQDISAELRMKLDKKDLAGAVADVSKEILYKQCGVPYARR